MAYLWFRIRAFWTVIAPQLFASTSNKFPRQIVSRLLLGILIGVMSCLWIGTPSALAGLSDDRYDGNIFPLYAGNGSLIPPRVSLAEALKREDKATLLFFYLDDSSDCKQFVPIVSQLDGFYGRAADFISVNVDSIPIKASYNASEPGYYYKGLVPQVLVLDQAGKVRLDKTGSSVTFEQIDDVLREVFDLLPRSESVELKRRLVNEFNTELTPDTP